MAVTIASIIIPVNTYLGDISDNSVTTTERINAISEATAWIIENTTNDHTIKTYNLDFIAGLTTYKISSGLADMLEPSDLRRSEVNQFMAATRKSPRELAEDIANDSPEFAFAIQRQNSDALIKINLNGLYSATQIATFDTTTTDGGTWVADAVNSDANTLTTDSTEFTEGTGSIRFNVTVAQSANNRATISNTINSQDLSSFLDIGVLVLDVFIPSATFMQSVTLYWGSDSSNYWSYTATTDAQGNTIATGWNTFKFDWNLATKTSTPVITTTKYYRIDVNYTASQPNDTSFRLDNLRIAHPERLTFYYLSDALGTTAGGTALYRYTATTDIPYYSGQYDHYIYPIAHKATAILMRSIGLDNYAKLEDEEANKSLATKIKLFPSSIVKEDRAFKVKQVNLRRRKFTSKRRTF